MKNGNYSVTEARQIQLQMLRKLKFDDEFEFSHIKTLAGIDVSYEKKSNRLYAGVVVFSFPDFEKVERFYHIDEAEFPYIPGYLSFREGPAIIEIFKKYNLSPDILLVDGHGIAHPRKLGIATYLGIELGIPSIGIAKKKLIGQYSEPGIQRGSYSWLTSDNEIIGIVYRSRTGVKPIFISPGYKIPLMQTFNLVKNLPGKFRLPEPIRQAHLFVNEIRQNDQ